MDLRAMMDGSGGGWTEARHSRYLNWIENNFVHQMLGVQSDGGNFHRCAERLDRRVPDSVTGYESAKNSLIRSPPSATDPDRKDAAIVAGVNNCNYIWKDRKRSLRRCDASLDQVVPEFKQKSDGEDASKGK